eukprot:6869292-Ditylum_brightwellii.AAC.1
MRKLASEIKVGTLVLQSVKKGMSPHRQLMARPQIKNESSDFNVSLSKAVKDAENILHSDGFKLSFINSANDGVSCDSKFVREGLFAFLEGKQDYASVTDTNHNVKNSRYQTTIGGNSVKTIGVRLIDTGMLKKQSFVQNYIGSKILQRAHLYAVNYKGNLPAEQGDVTQPHRLTSEPSEHTFALIHSYIFEFTVLDFMIIVQKIDRTWANIIEGKLKGNQDPSS